MFASLLGLLAFQAYWITSAYKQKKSTIESEIKEAFSKANNGLLIKKLGDYSGVDVQVTASGGFYAADTVMVVKDHFNVSGRGRNGRKTRIIHGDASGLFNLQCRNVVAHEQTCA